MTRRAGSVVAMTAQALAALALTALAACGQKGALVAVKPAPPAVATSTAAPNIAAPAYAASAPR